MIREPHPCPECNLVYYSKGALTTHLKREHNAEPPNLTERFMAKFFSLDTSDRRIVCVQFNNQPCSWNVVWIEVRAKTAMADSLLAKMGEEGTI